MAQEEFDKGLKLLKRFLKDKGQYVPIYKNFLFRNNRKPEDLFKEFNNPCWTDVDNWLVLFQRLNLLFGSKVPPDWKVLYTRAIDEKGIVTSWRAFCYEHNLGH